MRLGISKSKTSFLFCSALAFHYICGRKDKSLSDYKVDFTRIILLFLLEFLGISKSKTSFLFCSALAFHYICGRKDKSLSDYKVDFTRIILLFLLEFLFSLFIDTYYNHILTQKRI